MFKFEIDKLFMNENQLAFVTFTFLPAAADAVGIVHQCCATL